MTTTLYKWKEKMKKELTKQSSMAAQCKSTNLHLAYWTLSWVLATALATFGTKFLWDYNTVFTILGILLQVGIGFGMIFAFKRHLFVLDELMQKIQLEAMAISLGVTLVVGLSYSLLDDVKLITFQPDISHVVMLMGLSYLAAVIIGSRRFR